MHVRKGKFILFIFILFGIMPSTKSQTLYFPPLTGNNWENLSPDSLGWCTTFNDTLFNFLQSTHTKAFLVLKDGRIVIEKYFGTFTLDSPWYWTSAGKTLTSLVVGIAQQEGLLKLSDTTSRYLGKGWTSLPPEKEDRITIKHQITMTTGLDDTPPVDKDCTDSACLKYKADAGTRWAYHNAPYTLLDAVIESASGKTYQQYFNSAIRNKTGMTGLWIKSADNNNIFYSTPRSMARYGLLLLNKGKWGNTGVLTDTGYFHSMVNTSQPLNVSYGYLTWLNGKTSFMAPGSQFVFPTMICPDGTADMFMAMGKNGQLINVVPSQNLVVIRMGDAPGDLGEVPITYNNDIWKQLNKVICKKVEGMENVGLKSELNVYPNPVTDKIYISGIEVSTDLYVDLLDLNGKIVLHETGTTVLDVSSIVPGYYSLLIRTNNSLTVKKVVKIESKP